jgi:protein gp37
MNKTSIAWTDRTWNPSTGCDPISNGCANCYSKALSKRLHAMGSKRYTNGFKFTIHADKIRGPVSNKKPARIFVNSMSDLLHKDAPDDFIMDVFDTMAVRAPWHEYQVLTKRAERWPEISEMVVKRFGRWPQNVIPGVTVESIRYRYRLNLLGCVGDDSTTRMVSAEPLLGSLLNPHVPRHQAVDEFAQHLNGKGISHLVTGGESGFKARPAQVDWFRELRDACLRAGVPFFFKQHGGRGVTEKAKRGGELAVLDGRTWTQRPEVNGESVTLL